MSSNVSDPENLPFYSLSHDEFSNINNQNNKYVYFRNNMDSLSQLKFNLFQINSVLALSENNEELDALFDINKVDCDYFLLLELKRKLSNIEQKTQFSMFHLNIRSITNKFD